MVSRTENTNLPKIEKVKTIVGATSVGFEWGELKTGLEGVNLYRIEGTGKELTLVGTISSPFSSHYVDTGLKQNTLYTYSFTTLQGSNESKPIEGIAVKTLPPFEAVTFFQGFQKAQNTIKLIWRPHPLTHVKMYKIEKSINGQQWNWIDNVPNRMMSEYIDTYVAPGNRYDYRIVAVGFDDSFSQRSAVITIMTK
jgi:fibronectin type 3 domain-containing protein